MRFRLILGLLLASVAMAQAASLPDYLKLRKKYGITQATTSLALDTLVGEGVLEVKAKVKGTFSVEGSRSLLLEVAGTDPVVVKGKNIPDWLNNPNTEARMLIRARRSSEFGILDAELIDAVEEYMIKDWEAKQKPPAPIKISPPPVFRKGKKLQTPYANRGGFYNQTNAKTWNLAPN